MAVVQAPAVAGLIVHSWAMVEGEHYSSFLHLNCVRVHPGAEPSDRKTGVDPKDRIPL